jgi:hypothetical protein
MAFTAVILTRFSHLGPPVILNQIQQSCSYTTVILTKQKHSAILAYTTVILTKFSHPGIYNNGHPDQIQPSRHIQQRSS